MSGGSAVMVPMSHTLRSVPMSDETRKRLARAGELQQKWRRERDEWIVKAFLEGGGVREIAREVGLTHPAVIKIIERAGIRSSELQPPKTYRNPTPEERAAVEARRRQRKNSDVEPTS